MNKLSKIIPERLKEVREIRGLNQSELARAMGVSRETISQYERGQSSPSGDKLMLLLMELRTPLSYLTTKRLPYEPRTKPITFRKRASAFRKSCKQAARQEEWAAIVYQYLSDQVEFPETNLYKFKGSQDLNDSRIEDIARATRKHWGLGEGPISNTVQLFENNGLCVFMSNFDEELDAFSTWRGARPVIFLSSRKQSKVRSRFDAAHELGHLVLHSNISESDLEDKATFNAIEKQAHSFAGAFLFPLEPFYHEFISLDLNHLISLKRRWDMSIQAIVMRAAHLEMITEGRKKTCFRRLSALGMRRKEPFDDEDIEVPQLLSQAFEILISTNTQSPSSILETLRMNVTDLVDIAHINAEIFKTDIKGKIIRLSERRL